MSEWHVYIDGACLGNPGKSGAGLVAFDTAGNELWHEGVHLGEMTNNMAEYEALVHAVRRARDSGDVSLFVYTDSQLVANQWNGIYKVKNKRLLAYLMEAKALARNLTSVRVQYIPRERNRVADGIAKRAAGQEQALP